MRVFASLFFLLLYGCTTQVQPELKSAVEEKLATERTAETECESQTDPLCSIHSPLLSLGRINSIRGTHHASLVEIGEEALKARIHLIRAARQSIDFQNFLFRRDDTGALIIEELLQAAKRGVTVRILFDQLFTVAELDYLARLALEHNNFEVRLYNPLFNKAKTNSYRMLGGVLCCFTRTNQRMHNKLLVVDDAVGMTGGRNIADRYFDFDPDYEFKDREVLVYGSTAVEMSTSFEQFWASDITAEIGHLRDVAPIIANGDLPNSPEFEVADRLKPLLRTVNDPGLMHALFVEPAHVVDSITYYYDPPHDSKKRPETVITDGLHAALAAATDSVVIQSPYLVLSKRSRELFKRLGRDHPEIDLIFSTNSLAATDAFSAYSFTHKHKKHYIKTLGFQVYEFRPYPHDAPDFFPRLPELIKEKKQGLNSGEIPAIGANPALDMPGPRSGLHAKSFVIDGYVSMVGSHNLDPRGEGFNTENGVIIYDTEFATELGDSIRKDIEPGNSWVAAMKPGKIPVLGNINSAIESFSRTLPVLDLWPYRSTTVYGLKPGGTPMSPDDEAFYDNYEPLGSFPGVVSGKRLTQVVLISSFLGFITPVL